jgi:hypothetical protein
MPITPVPVPPFPSVPPQPGVPPLAGNGYQAFTRIASTVAIMASDVGMLVNLFTDNAKQWGVFDKNQQPVAVWDSVASVDYRHEFTIADYPIEQGGFESYNKVAHPYDARVRFIISDGAQGGLLGGALGGIQTTIASFTGAKSPGMAARTALLQALETAVASLDLYTVITPEAQYQSANLTHMEYRREVRGGISLIAVDVSLQEVRIAQTAQSAEAIQQPQSATSEPAANDGSPQSPTVANEAQPVQPSSPSSNVAGVPGQPGSPSGPPAVPNEPTVPITPPAPTAPPVADVPTVNTQFDEYGRPMPQLDSTPTTPVSPAQTPAAMPPPATTAPYPPGIQTIYVTPSGAPSGVL